MENNESLGKDGLSKEFYECFQYQIKNASHLPSGITGGLHGHVKSCDKLETLYLHFDKVCAYQTWKNGELG